MFFHPTMCRQSLSERKCSSQGRCRFGYHVAGTEISEDGEETSSRGRNGNNRNKKNSYS